MGKQFTNYKTSSRPASIIEAKYQLTKRQMEIVDIVFSQVNDENDTKENVFYTIDLKKYFKLYDVKDKKSLYKEMAAACRSVAHLGGDILPCGGQRGFSFNWFSSIEYFSDHIEVEISHKVKRLFLEAKGLYDYPLKCVLNFKHIYTKRIYYYLKRFEDTGERWDNLLELMDKMLIPENSVYRKRYASFKQRVLDLAKEEINKAGDISFDYEEKRAKTGQKHVQALHFIIKKKCIIAESPFVKISEMTNRDNEITLLSDYGYNGSEADEILRCAYQSELYKQQGISYLEKALSLIHKKKNCRNKVGLACSFMLNGYFDVNNNKSEKTGTFNFSEKDLTKAYCDTLYVPERTEDKDNALRTLLITE